MPNMGSSAEFWKFVSLSLFLSPTFPSLPFSLSLFPSLISSLALPSLVSVFPPLSVCVSLSFFSSFPPSLFSVCLSVFFSLSCPFESSGSYELELYETHHSSSPYLGAPLGVRSLHDWPRHKARKIGRPATPRGIIIQASGSVNIDADSPHEFHSAHDSVPHLNPMSLSLLYERQKGSGKNKEQEAIQRHCKCDVCPSLGLGNKVRRTWPKSRSELVIPPVENGVGHPPHTQ